MTQTAWGPAEQIAWLSSPELATWMAAALGRQGTLPGVHTVTVQHRPGAGVSALVQVSSPDSAEPLIIGLTTEDVEPLPSHHVPPGYGPRVCRGPGGPVMLWPHPYDPRLPGLVKALDPGAVQQRWGHGAQVTAVRTRTYRPLRRAVMVAATQPLEDVPDAPRGFFLKVLHAGAEDLARRHLMLDAAGVPVPRLRLPADAASMSDAVRENTIALDIAPGRSLATALAAQETHPLNVAHLLRVLDAMPAACLDLERKDAWSDRIEDHALAARAAFPSLVPEIDSVLFQVRTGLDTFAPGRVVPTHGDLYEANVFVHDSRVSTLLDLDGVGPGHRVDDLACLVAHLSVLPSLDRRYARVPSGLRRMSGALLENVTEHGADPQGLWVRAAAVVLTLVAGIPGEGHDDDQEAARERLALAERLLALAR